MYYFGLLKHTTTVEVFWSKIVPDYPTHGHLYGLVFGGHKTLADATERATYIYPCAKVIHVDMRTKVSRTHRALYAIAGIV